jgi:formylglycine-generating enzyme required for sulfatase activity
MKSLLSFFSFFLILIVILVITPCQALAGGKGISVALQGGKSLYLYKDCYALVVGVGNYDQWPDLPHAVDDAKEISRFFRQKGFKVKLVLDPGSQDLKKALDDFVREAGQEPGRAIVFYYVGHGKTQTLADGTKLDWIIPRDCPLLHDNPRRDQVRDNPRGDRAFSSRAINLKAIEKFSNSLRSKHVLMFFDSAFSGAAFSLGFAALKVIDQKSVLPMRQYIIAGREGEHVPDQSVFKRFLLKGLKGDADFIHDGYITGSELGYYLTSRIEKVSGGRQHPQYAITKNPALAGGDFIFLPGEVKSDTGRLFVKTDPQSAQVKILNKGPQFKQGMELKQGKYHLEVSSAGYTNHKEWITLEAGEDKVIDIQLQKSEEVPATGGATGRIPATGGATGKIPATGGATGKVPATGGATGRIPATGSATGKISATGGATGKIPATGRATGQISATGSGKAATEAQAGGKATMTGNADGKEGAALTHKQAPPLEAGEGKFTGIQIRKRDGVLVNSLGMEFVLIKPGSFVMGSPSGNGAGLLGNEAGTGNGTGTGNSTETGNSAGSAGNGTGSGNSAGSAGNGKGLSNRAKTGNSAATGSGAGLLGNGAGTGNGKGLGNGTDPGNGASLYEEDEKVHRVIIKKGFYLQTTEVTVGQFRKFIQATGYVADAAKKGSCWVRTEGGVCGVWRQKKDVGWDSHRTWETAEYAQTEKHPVTCVAWNDAQAFIQWLSRKEGGKEGVTYELPTEAEWEYACRAGTTTPFSFGRCLSTDQADYDGVDPLFADCRGSYRNDRQRPIEAGSLAPNPWKLFDMHGNIAEWCQDWYAPYPDTDIPVTDPKGPLDGTDRVIRGGHWAINDSGCRSAKRESFPPDAASEAIGFRLVMRVKAQ